MKEFKINEYLSLKLESTTTSIFVKDKRFNQCKYLLLDVPLNGLDSVKFKRGWKIIMTLVYCIAILPFPY